MDACAVQYIQNLQVFIGDQSTYKDYAPNHLQYAVSVSISLVQVCSYMHVSMLYSFIRALMIQVHMMLYVAGPNGNSSAIDYVALYMVIAGSYAYMVGGCSYNALNIYSLCVYNYTFFTGAVL